MKTPYYGFRFPAAARRFFRKVLRSHPAPRKIITDQLLSYPVAKAEVPELASNPHSITVE
jgi:putative transposase